MKKKILVSGICMLLIAAVAITSAVFFKGPEEEEVAQELPVFLDSFDEELIMENEVPLSGTTTKTSTKKTTKEVKLSRRARRTCTKKHAAKTTTSTKSSVSGNVKTVTKTTVKTQKTDNYRKSSNIKKVTTTTTTTVATTTSTVASATSTAKKETVSLTTIAPKIQTNVKNAYEKMGFTVIVDPSVSYAGYFNATSRTITVRTKDDNMYHEMGHFVAFAAGNVDTSSAFVTTFNKEKSNYTGRNASYCLSTASEYFAESYREYILYPDKLEKERPETYKAMENAVNRITDAQVQKYMIVFASVWK